MRKQILLDNMVESQDKEDILNFLDKLYSSLPEYFKEQSVTVQPHDDSLEIEVLTNEQEMLENLIDELEHKMNLAVFFVIRKNNGKDYDSVLFSEPVMNGMYIIYVTSHTYGMVDSIVVQFYNSMDIMFDQLYKENRMMNKVEGDIIEQLPIREIINKFY